MNRGNDASSTVLVQPGILVQNIDLPRIDQQAYQVAALGAAVDMFHGEFAQASTGVACTLNLLEEVREGDVALDICQTVIFGMEAIVENKVTRYGCSSCFEQ